MSLSYGFTNDINCICDFSSNSKIISYDNSGKNYYVELTLHSLFKNITLSENEVFFIAIKTEKYSDQSISISYEQNCDIYWILDEIVDDQYFIDVIKNIKDILDIYVYTDIAKTPPDIIGYKNYHHRKINLKEGISKISTSNRKFYEFYQDIKRILTTVKDLHFNIYPQTTPKKYDFSKYYAYLPFNFVIKQYNKEYRIFIEKNSDFNDFDKDSQKFINNHLNIPLKSINNIDPFDYIQNWSKFRATKNIHSQFTNIINVIPFFSLANYPFNYSDLVFNEYVFENNEVLRLSYKFWYPKQNIIKAFNKYFQNYLKNDGVQEIPSYKQIYNNFLMRKDKKKILKIENSNINNQNWDVIYKDKDNNILKCKVDKINNVNVIVQNSFSLEIYKGIGTILKCSKLFYSNSYPIFIIESKNGGGKSKISIIMTQIFQTRILFRRYRSYKITDISTEYFQNKYYKYINPIKCEEIRDASDIYYKRDTFDGSIFFNRTIPLDLLDVSERQALKDFREKYYNNANSKNPTDIIVFTDAFSYSATSAFIKSLQTAGGAITVGYYGNPKIEGIDKFDASQSPSQVEKLTNTNMYKELFNLGIIIYGVTTGETFYFYQNNLYGQIPGEYTFDPVDDRIDIYSDYNHGIYNDFIQEGLKIHEKFNKNNMCNSKNKKLLLHNDGCYYIEGKDYAHGGYKCNDNNEWDTSKCEPYYCDFDYYFDQIQNECIKDCEFSDVKSKFIFEDNYDEEFIIEPGVRQYFIFVNNEDDIAYCITDYSNQLAQKKEIGCYNEGNVLMYNNNIFNYYKV